MARLKDSRIAGFYRMSVDQRIDALRERHWLDAPLARRLKDAAVNARQADRMIENVIGVFGLPLAVAPNFKVNGRDYVVPMVVEEPSIVAGVSSAARLVHGAGGFRAEAGEPLLIGQVLLSDVPDPDAAVQSLEEAAGELVALANALQPNLEARGGGARSIEIHKTALPDDGPWVVVLHLLVDTCDAMGANIVNSMCEGIAPRAEVLSNGKAVLKILSNLADRSLVTASTSIPLAALEGRAPERVRDAIVLATAFADADPYRAATHNKGVMNGIDAVAIATGNDWRAIEAAAHAWAARTGRYRSLTRWGVDAGGNLAGELVMPIKVGIVGGSLESNPAVQVGMQLANARSAGELAELMAAVGLAQNFAALRALVTVGIQKGHMRLHARSVAASAGAPPEHFDRVVAELVGSGDIKVRKARELVGLFARERQNAAPQDDWPVHGTASGKVILLGEHAAVYGRHVLALPLENAVTASVLPGAPGTTLRVFGEDEEPLALPGTAKTGFDGILSVIQGRLGLCGRNFNIRLHSRIPRAAGLGSSAAVAVALIRAFSRVLDLKLDDQAVNELAFECEKLAHGDPSGIDNALATYGQPLLFRKNASVHTKTLVLEEFPPLVIAATGTRSSTREQVRAVRSRHARMPERFEALFDEIDAMSIAGSEALLQGDYERLGSLMNVCQGLLNAIGVSTPELERMADIARRAGAVGAKLTGAGGGGAIVALCPGVRAAVERDLGDAGYRIVPLK